MNLSERIDCFVKLGVIFKDLSSDDLMRIKTNAQIKNTWFTRDFIDFQLSNLNKILTFENISNWISKYDFSITNSSKSVGIIMAGNIPLVGFHDLICVVLSGNIAKVKASSDDLILTNFVIEKLFEIDSRMKNYVHFVERLNDVDALIATGSNNSARYFEYYFSKKPHIIRKNRTSVAVLDNHISDDELRLLSNDLFLFFGMGCRNVGKIFIPQDFDIQQVFKNITHWDLLIENYKFKNNYDYNRAMLMMKNIPFLENNFVIFLETTELFSPIGMVFYERYTDLKTLNSYLLDNSEKIQCIVSNNKIIESSISLGETQNTDLHHFADGVDIMEFCIHL